MRYVWRTRRLEDGELRRDLLELCAAHRVRVRELLVWDTHGVLVNGAVMGVAGAMRFVLLSDGLLGGLTRDEVEAVAAHEVGHVRRRHIPWLAGAVVSSLVLAGAGADRAALAITGHRVQEGPWLLAIGAAMLVAGGLVLSLVNRRLDLEGEAFAAQHLSGARPGDGDVEVTPAAAGAMEGALAAVARLNHIPAEAPSFRHGSIASRRRRLRALVGRRADRLPIDRTAARIKAAIALGVVATVVLVALDLGG
jgi:STE24 endopeptidase